jgi:hypothetical protein
MPPNPYDQACRYLLRLWDSPLLAWLLRLAPEQLDFVEWLDTRQVVWPGHPEQTCDTVAHLRDPRRGGLPWAAVVEFQIEPDELMFGRGLRYLGDLWQTCKPTGHKGDRFEVGLVVVNLTGRGRTSRSMHLSGTRLKTRLGAEERNLADLSARKVLQQVEAGKAPRALLAWVPLFKGGGRPGIIHEWLRQATQEKDGERRRSLGLAVVFAEASGCGDAWREALKEWDVVESKIVKEWQAQAASLGEIRGKREMLLVVLESRFGPLPLDLSSQIRACDDAEKLLRWAQLAGKVPSLDGFRHAAAL